MDRATPRDCADLHGTAIRISIAAAARGEDRGKRLARVRRPAPAARRIKEAPGGEWSWLCLALPVAATFAEVLCQPGLQEWRFPGGRKGRPRMPQSAHLS